MVEEIKKEPAIEDGANEGKKESALSEYKAILEVITELDSNLKMLEEMIGNTLESKYGLKISILDNMLQYTKENIPNMASEDICDFVKDYTCTDEHITDILGMSHDELINMMLDLKDTSLSILASREEANEIKKDSSEALQEYFTYLSSDKVKEARKNRLAKMKELYEECEDMLQKKKLKKQIDTLELSFNFKYIKERLSKYGEDEVQRIINSAFKERAASSYLVEKFKSRAKHFGYKSDVFNQFFNIEDTFLPDEYKPMNNLFLFIYMRFVAHSDPYNKHEKLLVYSLTSALSDLKYHRLSSESAAELINVIKDVLDFFMPHIEEIKKINTSWKEHPENIKRVEEYRRVEIVRLGADIKKIKPDYIVPDDATVESLREEYFNIKHNMIKEQVDAYNEEKNSENNKTKEESSEYNEERVGEGTALEELEEAGDICCGNCENCECDHGVIEDSDDARYTDNIIEADMSKDIDNIE